MIILGYITLIISVVYMGIGLCLSRISKEKKASVGYSHHAKSISSVRAETPQAKHSNQKHPGQLKPKKLIYYHWVLEGTHDDGVRPSEPIMRIPRPGKNHRSHRYRGSQRRSEFSKNPKNESSRFRNEKKRNSKNFYSQNLSKKYNHKESEVHEKKSTNRKSEKNQRRRHKRSRFANQAKKETKSGSHLVMSYQEGQEEVYRQPFPVVGSKPKRKSMNRQKRREFPFKFIDFKKEYQKVQDKKKRFKRSGGVPRTIHSRKNSKNRKLEKPKNSSQRRLRRSPKAEDKHFEGSLDELDLSNDYQFYDNCQYGKNGRWKVTERPSAGCYLRNRF